MTTRILNIFLGLWLFISTFMWPHSHFQMANSLICGFLTMALGIAAMYRREAVYLGAAVGVWLFFSTVIAMVSHRDATFFNNGIMAIAIFVTSLFGKSPAVGVPERRDRLVHG